MSKNGSVQFIVTLPVNNFVLKNLACQIFMSNLCRKNERAINQESFKTNCSLVQRQNISEKYI